MVAGNTLARAHLPARGSAVYNPHNLLDVLSSKATLQAWYAHEQERERALITRRLRIAAGSVLAVGCGWHAGRHLFPAPGFRIVASDVDPERPHFAVATGEADEAVVGAAGELELESGSFDVVLYRLVLHHIVYQQPLGPCFEEARRLLRPGGALVAIEPGAWHPIGLMLGLANRTGLATRIHGTPDDVPLSPRLLVAEARRAGLTPEIVAISFGWRRLPRPLQAAMRPLDGFGAVPGVRLAGHTLMLIARSQSRAPARRGFRTPRAR